MSALAPLEKLAPSWKRVADGRGTPGLFRIMTKAKAGKKGRPAPSPAAGVEAAYEFRADSAAVADLLDLDASAVDHTRGRKAPATSVRLEAARLRAVRALGDDFRVRCAVLGPKTFAYFENWLWAARAEMADAPVVPVLTQSTLALTLTRILTLTLTLTLTLILTLTLTLTLTRCLSSLCLQWSFGT